MIFAMHFDVISKRAASGLAALVFSTAVTACGGSADEAMQFASSGAVASNTQFPAAGVQGDNAGAGTQSNAATAPALITFNDLVYVDPAPLQQMLAMNDNDFAAMLANDWTGVENILHDYIPPNVAFDFPTPMGFIGPWDACMKQHTAPACREHMTLLVELMKSKAP